MSIQTAYKGLIQAKQYITKKNTRQMNRKWADRWIY